MDDNRDDSETKPIVRHPTTDLVGQVLGERYRIEKRLSHGGMGVVYRARHVVLETDLAVKVLLRPQDETDQQRFLQEAKLASLIQHPNTVQIIDFGVLPAGQSYLVMELMRGGTLADELEKGPMDALRACQIGAQIARALQAVHDKGIIHRDMKPENVFLLETDGSKDFVKVVDFGIAKPVAAEQSPLALLKEQQGAAASSEDAGASVDASPSQSGEQRNQALTEAGAIVGTPRYMSPEQCQGIPLDGRVDQYALGCMLYEMLTGHCPFDGMSAFVLLTQHLTKPPVPPRQRIPERAAAIPASLEAVVLRMLAKHPEQRFSSMRAVEQALCREADAILVQRGEKTVLPAGLAGLLGGRLQRGQLLIRGRRVPLWAAGAVALSILALSFAGAGILGYRLYQMQRSQKATLEPGELQTARARALEKLKLTVKAAPLELRIDAIAALGATQDFELRPELEALLLDPEEAVQAEAAAALGRLGDKDAVSRLRAVLDGSQDKPLLRLTIARALLELGDASGEAQLLQTLAEGAPEVRLRAASMLCDRRNAIAEKLLLQVVDRGLLKEESAVLGALGCLLRSQSAEPARARLHERLKGASTPRQQIEIAAVLSRAGDGEGRRVLRELSSRPGLEQLPAARALAAPDVPDVADLFRSVLSDRQAQDAARLLASEGLGQSGGLLDVRLLGKVLQSGTLELQEAAAVGILRLCAADPTALGSESLRWARGSLGAGDWQLRESAALVLGDSAAPEAVSLLRGMLQDRDARVRRGSVRALGRHTEETALLALQETLQDTDPEVRLETIRSLGRVGQSLRKAGVREVLSRVSTLFQGLLQNGTVKEKILIRSTLLQLGDANQRQALHAMQGVEDPAARRFLLEQAPADAELSLTLLRDSDAGVRFAAAQKLAELGDVRALPTLKEALKGAGADSIAAYGLLSKFEQNVPEPAALRSALTADHPVPERMAAIEAMAHMPAALAVPLLLQAARDPEPLVRRLCAEVAAELPEQPRGPPGFPVLRFLLGDRNPLVRNRAKALLSRVSLPSAPPPSQKDRTAPAQASRADAESSRADSDVPSHSADVPQTAAETDAGAESAGTAGAEPPESAEPSEGDGETKPTSKGTLLLDAAEGTLFQIDGGKWQAVSGKGVTLAVGAHKLTTLGGSYEITLESDKKFKLKLVPSPVDEAVELGARAYQQKEFGRAQKHYDRASALCGHDRANKKACLVLELNLALSRGRIFEQEKRFSEAMAEYQKLAEGGHGKARVEGAEAIARLSPQLGKVILRTAVKGKCQERVQWLIPGKKQKIKVGDKSQPVSVRAGQTVLLGECP